MSMNEHTKKEIQTFAREHALDYLDAAEMSYLEQLKAKARQTKSKAKSQLARFKSTSDKALEAQSDLALYMSDYINDLMSQGMSEEAALAQAKEALSAAEDSEHQAAIQARMASHWEMNDPKLYEMIGLVYGGLTVFGLALGGLIGWLFGGWLNFAVGGAVGTLFGACFGLLAHAGILFVYHKD